MQQQQTYVRQALQQIAFEMGKPVTMVEPYILILEENWYDTKDAIKQMKIEDFDQFKIPKRISQLLIEYVQKPEDKSINWQLEIAKIISEIPNQEQTFKTFEVLFKIITTVISNPLSQQFQRINISSKTLQNNILQYNSSLNYLKLLGWKIEAEFLVSNYNMDQQQIWQEAAQELLSQTNQSQQFNPQKAQISSTSGVINSQIAQQEGYNIYSFSDKLRELQNKRLEIMSQPINNREIKIFIGKQQQSGQQIQQLIQSQDDFEEVQPQQDSALIQFIKQMALNLEEQQFSSKRKKEYEELLQRPVFSKTEIRVHFPNNIIVQAFFSPLETLQCLYDMIKEILQDPNLNFYLFTPLPPMRMGEKQKQQTFDDLSSVPSGLFYFGVDSKQIQGENYISQQWIEKAKEL